MKIGIGNDHVAVEYKEAITAYIQEKYGYEVVNFGTDSTERFDYPIAGKAVADAVMSGEVDRGIVICGTGVGISLAANKVRGIRCCTCSEPYSARLSREHNNTNMLAFGARVVGIELDEYLLDIQPVRAIAQFHVHDADVGYDSPDRGSSARTCGGSTRLVAEKPVTRQCGGGLFACRAWDRAHAREKRGYSLPAV